MGRWTFARSYSEIFNFLIRQTVASLNPRMTKYYSQVMDALELGRGRPCVSTLSQYAQAREAAVVLQVSILADRSARRTITEGIAVYDLTAPSLKLGAQASLTRVQWDTITNRIVSDNCTIRQATFGIAAKSTLRYGCHFMASLPGEAWLRTCGVEDPRIGKWSQGLSVLGTHDSLSWQSAKGGLVHTRKYHFPLFA